MISLIKIISEIRIISNRNWDEEFQKCKEEAANEWDVDLEDDTYVNNLEDEINNTAREIFKEKFGFEYNDLKEENVTGGSVPSGGTSASFTPGFGENYATPKAFGPTKRKKYKKRIKYTSGYKKVKS